MLSVMNEGLRPLSAPDPGKVFRILVVDDDPAEAHVLQELMKNLQRKYELHAARDGVEALEFLRRQGAHAEASRPDLILLDVSMPRFGGLETLSTIKSDPELCVIPVIMFSTSGSARDVRQSYQARANCYVQKPADLKRFVKLLQAVETFWMEFALLPEVQERTPNSQLSDSKREPPRRPGQLHSGPPIAAAIAEASSQAMHTNDSPELTGAASRSAGCDEHNRLLNELGATVRELIELLEQQFRATVEGDSDCHRFDLLIHMANEKKQLAKYTYLRHVEEHGCLNFNVTDHSRT